ncbi:MAG: hypothetical protein IPI01_20620 [Ignavibacteriae bacterium]|nr:hypothetical protein [Ignavibacteriota bacterium]
MKHLIFVVLALTITSVCTAQPFPTPLSPGGTYDPSVPAPTAVTGRGPAEYPMRYDQVIDYCRRLAAASPRVRMVPMGESTEHRPQYYLTISDPANIAALDRIKADHARLADPRQYTEAAAKDLARTLPAVVWIGFGIHGDELSSVDAAVNVAYQLAAGTDTSTLLLLKNLVVVLDPMENPDGRERFLAQLQQWSGAVENTDAQSIHHTGTWPGGRGSHYFFDLNRDWFVLTHPETRARVKAVVEWHPQVFIDAHEMGPYDTYLFSPPREPINPNVSSHTRHWWSVFSKDQARAFDRFGWSYYTREWNDDWFPGYANSWGHYLDAVGILYEQAGVRGTPVARPDGTTLRFRETVHHHVVSALANCQTAARHREELLERYATARREAMRPAAGQPRAYAFVRENDPGRADRLVQVLLQQGIEVSQTGREITASNATPSMGGAPKNVLLPRGSYIVPMDQPSARLARAILEFDPHMTTAFLQEERKDLEKKSDSRLYDITAWSLPIAYGVDAYALGAVPDAGSSPVKSVQPPAGVMESAPAPYGYLIPYDDRGVATLARLFDNDVRVRSAREPFSVEGRSYPRGTLLVRVNENADTLRSVLDRLATQPGVTIRAIGTALSTAGPDLGGNDFVLLYPPRVALLGGPGVGSTSFGATWLMLDDRLRLSASFLQVTSIASADLRRYSVIILPSIGDARGLAGAIGKGGVARLRTWIEEGGTLIGIGGGATAIADTGTGLSEVRLRHQALKELDLFVRAADLEARAEKPEIDSIALWSGRAAADTARAVRGATPAEKELAMLDERGRLFMPRGTMMRVDLDEEHWLSFGAGKSVAASMFTSSAFLARDPVRTAGRFAAPSGLRVAGLLWPEARDRWARTAYLTREGKGKGQIILFAGEASFRASFPATERLLINAILLGPGWGTDQLRIKN